jgi:hypothetical protein
MRAKGGVVPPWSHTLVKARRSSNVNPANVDVANACRTYFTGLILIALAVVCVIFPLTPVQIAIAHRA